VKLPAGCELPAGSVCSGCGLTHRAIVSKKGAVSFDVACACGSISDYQSKNASTSHPKDYRRDPALPGQVLLLQRHDTTMEDSE
jgi:hypothetical protein